MENREGPQPEPLKPSAADLPTHGPEVNGAYREGTPALQAPPESDAPEDDGNFWTPGNIVMLAIILGVLAFLVAKFNLEGLLNIGKAALGLSFVIFIHELGHFLAAKSCDVRVTTFSIGFGPAIPGCRFKWGETIYKLAIFPLGGYVQMVGQVDGDEASDGSEDDPRSYRRKSVGQRMLIISAGVIMNALLAIVCFIYVYLVPGKDYLAATVNEIDSAGPLFVKGARTGAVITEVGQVKDPTFTDVTMAVISTLNGQQIELTLARPGRPPRTIEVEPRKVKGDDRPVIGFRNAPSLKLPIKHNPDGGGPCFEGTAAANAGFEYGNVIIGMSDPDKPGHPVTDLPIDPRNPSGKERDYFAFWRRLQLLMDQEIVVRVQRTKDKESTTKDLKVAPMYHLDLGVVMQMGPVQVVRAGSPADQKINPPSSSDDNREGDLIEAVRVVDADGKPREFKGKTLDPERLPFQLRQWSDRLDKAKFAGKRTVTLQVRRHRAEAGAQFKTVNVDLAWDPSWRFDRVVPVSDDSPMAIPELGLAYEIKTTVAHVLDPKSPLKVGDVIKNVQCTIDSVKPEDGIIKWMRKPLQPGQWPKYAAEILSRPFKFEKIEFKIERDKLEQDVEIPVKLDHAWPLANRGWQLLPDMRHIKADSVGKAILMGLKDTHNRMFEVFLSIRGMVTGRIAVSNIAGPLSMAQLAYRFAGMDFGDLVFFLGLISINLAVVNFLPIPVLDGGHMVFLIYEAIRGKPASETVRVIATYIGLALIGCLMIFVLYLDVSRLFFWQH